MADVDLTYAEHRTVSGTFGGETVRLEAEVPASRGSLSGVVGPLEVMGQWRLDSNVDTREPGGVFLGECGDEFVSLDSRVQLGAKFAFESASVTGTIGSDLLDVRVAHVDGPAYGAQVVGVDGRVGDAGITLYVAVEGDLSGGQIQGTVAGQAVQLTTTGTQVTGRYDADPRLLPLFILALKLFV